MFTTAYRGCDSCHFGNGGPISNFAAEERVVPFGMWLFGATVDKKNILLQRRSTFGDFTLNYVAAMMVVLGVLFCL